VPESAVHISLVEEILDYAQHRFNGSPGVMILADLPTTPSSEKPPRVGGYAPDVYATEVPRATVLIGEAKSQEDLTTPHSRDQIVAFLKFLRYQQRGIFVLAVPWHCFPSAQIVIATARRCLDLDSNTIEVVVLDGLKKRYCDTKA